MQHLLARAAGDTDAVGLRRLDIEHHCGDGIAE
jgi:hypothetical protein